MTNDAPLLRIERLGHKGDGVASYGGHDLHIPYTLPGELVRLEQRDDGLSIKELVEPSPKRIDPICDHYGRCGGCQIQHLRPKSYRIWKKRLIEQAFAQRGIEASVSALQVVPTASRRRACFEAHICEHGFRFGYHQRSSQVIVDLEACPLLHPSLAAKLSDLRRLAQTAVKQIPKLRLLATVTDTGLDVDLQGSSLHPINERKLTDLAQATGLTRLSINQEELCTFRSSTLSIGGISVDVPPAVFLQATAQSERALQNHVVQFVGDAPRVLDLFSGIGTFSLPLARQSAVEAVDLAGPALTALDQAVRRTSGLRPVTAISRDLFLNPIMARDLSAFDAVIFDPPRAGAEAQVGEIAKSSVPLVIAVSCNPATLARDARLLIDGGYRMVTMVAVDQFLYSSHIEVVAVFQRGT